MTPWPSLGIALAALIAASLGFGGLADAGAAAAIPKPAKSPPVWDDHLLHRIKVFLGGTRGAYVISSRSVFANFFQAVGMRYNDDVEQAQYGWILNGFRHHSAMEKGAVLLDRRGQVEAAGAYSTPMDCRPPPAAAYKRHHGAPHPDGKGKKRRRGTDRSIPNPG